jgi:peptidyl-prolyl cis-trans isomerase A (cyclophilin A)
MQKLLCTLILLISIALPGTGQKSNQKITISTDLGEIVLDLFTEEAPVSAGNFIKYIKGEFFRGSSFYRTVTMDNQPDNDIMIEVIQGGLSGTDIRPGIGPIEHETTEQSGILHLDGTLSMARSKPGSASSEFFICINDQPSLDYGGLRNPDGQGFAAFGIVIKGMDVVRSIHQSSKEGQRLNPTIKIINITIEQTSE